MKILNLILISCLSFSVSANSNVSDFFADGQKYVLPKEEGNNFLIGYANYLKKLNLCEEYEFNYYNPLIRKKGYYRIKGYKNSKCSLEINYNNLRELNCNLEEEDIKKIISGRVELIKNKDGFGQLSNQEIEIYFNTKKCDVKNIQKIINEKEIENFNKQLKEENPEIYEFLNNKYSK